MAPRILDSNRPDGSNQANGIDRDVAGAQRWAMILGLIALTIATFVAADIAVTAVIVVGLIIFGVAFAVNSSVHSYLILAYSNQDDVSADVGFYYSANAVGRFAGTLLSGLLYLWGGLPVALWGTAVFVGVTWILTLRLPAVDHATAGTSVKR